MSKNFLELQRKNEAKLSKFLEFFESALCKRCWADSHNSHCRPCHNHGGILELMGEMKIDKNQFSDWVKEKSHGFLHGFMTLYFAYCLCDDKDKLWDSCFFYNEHSPNYPRAKYGDKIIMSSIMHDFFKAIGQPEDHDKMLMKLSENLDPVIYNHANPLISEVNSPIIGADRLELMRFDDYKEWCDTDSLKSYVEKYGSIELLDHFFSHIRPVIEKMFLDRDDVWITHILEVNLCPMEKIQDNKGVDFYPISHWKAEDEGYSNIEVEDKEKYFSVNMGKLNSYKCLMHKPPIDGPIGIISLNALQRNNCDLRPAPPSTCGRDHPFVFANEKIPIKEWSYLYTTEQHLLLFDWNTNFHILSKELYMKIYSLSESFLTKLIALGVR
jgi:hypothetical protein